LKIFLNHSLQIIDQQAYCSRKTIRLSNCHAFMLTGKRLFTYLW